MLSSVQHQTAQPRKVNRNKISKLEKALESVERFFRTSGGRVVVGVGEGEAGSESAPFERTNFFDPRFHPSFRETFGRFGRRTHSRIQVARGGGERLRKLEAARWIGDLSPNSAVDGQFAGRVGTQVQTLQ